MYCVFECFFGEFYVQKGSFICVRLFCWSVLSLFTVYSTSLGTYMSSKVGSFLLGHSVVTVLNLLSSFPRMSGQSCSCIPKNSALLARFLSLLTPSFNALGSTTSFTSFFALQDKVFGSAAFTISPTDWGGLSLGLNDRWSFSCGFAWLLGDVASSSLYVHALSFLAVVSAFSVRIPDPRTCN
jgi:hypothetical protein